MLILLTTLLGTLSSMFRSRAMLELENLALRHQVGVAAAVREKTPEIDPGGPPFMGRAVPPVARLAFGSGHRQARNGRGLASCWLSPVLDLEGAARPPRTAGHFSRGSRSDPQDVPGESEVGCTPGSRGVAQAGHRHRRDQRQQIHGALSQAAVADLGARSCRITPSSWSLSTSSLCRPYVSRFSLCFWFWPMTDGAFCTAT